MPVQLSIEANLSLEDIRRAHEDGQSVVRSAHVGNQRPYNLAVAAARIPMLLIEQTIVAQTPDDAGDRNYLPGSIVTADAITPLAVDQVGGLTLQTAAADPETGSREFLDQLHTNRLRRAFPKTSVELFCDYLRSETAVASEVVKLAAEVLPGLFVRLAEGDGMISQSPSGSYAHALPRYGIVQLKDDPHTERGIISPNEVNLVIGFVIEALRYGNQPQIHLSGPDFYHYSTDLPFQKRLNRIYDTVRSRASFGSKLPENLQVQMVPAIEARFIAARGKGQALHELFALLGALADVEAKKSGLFKERGPATDEDFEAIATFDAVKREVRGKLGSLAIDSLGELFIGPRDAPYTSQHDVLKAGGVDMPAPNASLTMHELRTTHSQVSRALDGATRRRGRDR